MINDTWVKQYLGFLRAGEFEKMVPLKEQFLPESVFKYRPLTTASLDCIDQGWLWMSEAKHLNDTFECSLLIDNNAMLRELFLGLEFRQTFKRLNFTPSDINKIVKSDQPFEAYKNKMASIGVVIPLTASEQAERARANWEKDKKIWGQHIRICSFSTNRESLLMWAHYADNNKGLCVEYDVRDDNSIRAFLQPVYYSDARISVRNFEEMHSYSLVAATICKSSDWQYEQEWRLTYFTESQIRDKNNRLPMPVPKAIYLGPNFNDNESGLKERLLSITRTKNISLYEMRLHSVDYKLTVFPL